MRAGLTPSPGPRSARGPTPDLKLRSLWPHLTSVSFQEETRRKPKMSIVASAQPGGEPLCTVDV